MKTTLSQIRKHRPCEEGWRKLLTTLKKSKADDEDLPILTVLDSNGLEDALWCLRAVKGYDREIRLFAVWCARQVEHLMTDPRSKKALDVAEAYANGLASEAELKVARDAATAAANAAAAAAYAAAYAAYDAAYAAYDAAYAAAAAYDAAYAAYDAAYAAAAANAANAADYADYVYAANAAAANAAYRAAKVATRTAQEAKLREICTIKENQ